MLKTAPLSAETLAAVLEQSVDCVKLIAPDGSVRWMNANGLCAMEIDDFENVQGRQWAELWPDVSRDNIIDALPRASAGETIRFDAFCPTAKGAPRWWNVTVTPITGLTGQDEGFLAVSRDITETEVGRQALIIGAAELRHRLKNTYAMIGSLMMGFARGNDERQAFAKEMQRRLVSLSTAQALFATEDVPCEIADLIPALVAPFETPACPIIVADLAKTQVEQGQADAIALVLGELAVNSSKHGALAHGGSIAISTNDQGAALSLVWEERSLATVETHGRTGGQGLTIIDRIVTARDGRFAIDWRNDGPTVTLEFQLQK